MSKKEKSTFSHFFKEDAENIQDIINADTDKPLSKDIDLFVKEEFPRIKATKKVTEDELKVQWRKLRSFFRNSNNDQGLPDTLWPVMMAPFITFR